jgi:hypothetical protein
VQVLSVMWNLCDPFSEIPTLSKEWNHGRKEAAN